MDRNPEAPKRKTVVILSERSREIIRLFEERQQKRLLAAPNPKPPPSNTDLQSSRPG
jgi:hypothetical protein